MSSNNNTNSQDTNRRENKDSLNGISNMRPQKPANKPEQKPKNK